MEDELLDQWLDVRDDSQLDILADSFEIEEVTKFMDEHDKSGVTNTSLTKIIDCVSVKPNLLTVPVVEDMETDDI